MSVKQDASGRRYVEVEVEVPGTVEDAWDAIATGPGVSSWFVPTEELEDGTVVSHFGPGMDVVAKKTAWEPPHRFAAEAEGFGPGSPPMATEWSVEAKSGGTCVVRVVHSLFTSAADWDDQLESVESGWPTFFRILKLYLAHFPGMPCAAFRLVAFASEPEANAWNKLAEGTGLTHCAIGEYRRTSQGVPSLGGIVEAVSDQGHGNQVMLRLDEPTPGIAHFFAYTCGQVMLALNVYLYGEAAQAAASRDSLLWQTWMNEQFPAPAMSEISST